jgi:hypothetical protein
LVGTAQVRIPFMSDGRPIEIDAVLPPDGKGRAPVGKGADHASEVARIVAHWMDEFIRIPGTQIRLGLDPIIGLIPGFGGLLSSSVSLVVLVEAVRHRVAPSVLGRMGLNIVINELLDAVPVAGDAASIFFRSNSKNLELLNRWKAGEKASVKRGSRLMLVLIFGAIIATLGLWFAIWFSVLAVILHAIKSLFS